MAIGVEVPDLDNMIVVALARSQAPVRLHVDVGSRFPALISATGRCVAAFSGQPWKEIEKRFRLLRWHNAPSYDAWRKEVDQVRRQGFSIDRGNYIDGVTIVAVPVLNSRGTISHTIAAVGLGSQLDRASALALATGHAHRRARGRRATGSAVLEHKPEEWAPVFPRDKRVCAEIMLKHEDGRRAWFNPRRWLRTGKPQMTMLHRAVMETFRTYALAMGA